MNLTDIMQTPIHKAFDGCVKSAYTRGMRVTGSELIGLIPLQSMLDAGKYFLEKQQRSTGVSEDELIKIAVKSMGLDELSPFNPKERIIEYLLRDASAAKLTSMTLTAFANETASESPAPGGGSISAYVGALGVSLETMVANLSSHKPGWDSRWKEFSDWAEKGHKLKDELLKLVDEDTAAFNKIMSAFTLPKGTEEEKKHRKQAIQDATRYAIEVPFKVMQLSFESMAEQSVIGSLLIDPDALLEVIGWLQPEHFYIHDAGKVYGAMIDLHRNSRPHNDIVELSTVFDAQGDETIRYFMMDCINEVPTSINIKYYAETVRERATRRLIINTCTKGATLAYQTENNIDEVVSSF